MRSTFTFLRCWNVFRMHSRLHFETVIKIQLLTAVFRSVSHQMLSGRRYAEINKYLLYSALINYCGRNSSRLFMNLWQWRHCVSDNVAMQLRREGREDNSVGRTKKKGTVMLIREINRPSWAVTHPGLVRRSTSHHLSLTTAVFYPNTDNFPPLSSPGSTTIVPGAKPIRGHKHSHKTPIVSLAPADPTSTLGTVTSYME